MEKVFSASAIHQTAAWLWQQIASYKVIVFHGHLGAGKTTLIHAICEHIGVKDTVSSPTFSIINEYRFEKSGVTESIYHIDLYRLKNEEEAIRAGVEDCLYSGYRCLVEWPEKAPALLPDNTMHIYITVIDEANRKLELQSKN